MVEPRVVSEQECRNGRIYTNGKDGVGSTKVVWSERHHLSMTTQLTNARPYGTAQPDRCVFPRVDGAVPRVSEDDVQPPYASDGGELAQVKRDLRDAMRRADRAEAAAAANKAVARNLACEVHASTRKQRERRAEAARAAEARAARARALRYDALEEPFLGL